MQSPPEEPTMEWTAVDVNWKQVSGKLKEKFSALSAEELQFVDRTSVALVSKVRERTGLDRDTAERQVEALVAGLTAAHEPAASAGTEQAAAKPIEKAADKVAEKPVEKVADAPGTKSESPPAKAMSSQG